MLIDWGWLKTAEPWVQGLFGGAGATILWEALLKPTRERRSLAHVLAEEVGQTMQYAAGQRLYLNRKPKSLPDDFRLSSIVFQSVAARVGELPGLAGEIVLFYQRVDALNRLPAGYSIALADYENTSGEPIDIQVRRQRAAAQLESILSVFRTGLEKLVEGGNVLLPKLRHASWPWYRLDLWLRKPKLLDLDDLAVKVEQIDRLRDDDRRRGLGQ